MYSGLENLKWHLTLMKALKVKSQIFFLCPFQSYTKLVLCLWWVRRSFCTCALGFPNKRKLYVLPKKIISAFISLKSLFSNSNKIQTSCPLLTLLIRKWKTTTYLLFRQFDFTFFSLHFVQLPFVIDNQPTVSVFNTNAILLKELVMRFKKFIYKFIRIS